MPPTVREAHTDGGGHTSAALRFTGAGGGDVSSHFTVTPDPMNPTLLPVPGFVRRRFRVDVTATAPLGDVTLQALGRSEATTGDSRAAGAPEVYP